jgi:hypothetical protein
MNLKLAIACAAAIGLAGTAAAQTKPRSGSDIPEFVLTVPVVLERMAPEIHSVAVWCEVVNYADPAGKSGAARYGAYQGQPAPVIANAGPVIIPVQGYAPPPAGGAAAAKGVPPKPRPAWSVLRIESRDRMGKSAEVKASAPLNLKPPAVLPTEFVIVPHGGSANPDAAVILQANTKGATDPALGNAYGCHIAFRASAMIDGKQTEFSIFGTDPGNYTGLPTPSGSAVQARPDARPNTDAILHVYGDIPVKPRP